MINLEVALLHREYRLEMDGRIHVNNSHPRYPTKRVRRQQSMQPEFGLGLFVRRITIDHWLLLALDVPGLVLPFLIPANDDFCYN